MDREGGFNFKLLVPPRVNIGQTSAVRPQETNILCLFNMFSTSVYLPLFVTIFQKNSNPAQLCSKLFDEVEKIKFWKVKVDSDIALKERGLQDNKRTIETQRKAIQELQFENESLSIKLEEQISENEDLRNKNNATRNLCNILKDTFQRSAEKMQLFESEREETQQLLMENSETIQKLIAGFESLRIQAEADQQETRKMKEGLLQFEELKEKYYQEYNTKEEEVWLQIKLKMKENELQKIVLDFNETQKHCKELQEVTIQDLEGQLFTEIKKNKEHTFKLEELRRDITLHKSTRKRFANAKYTVLKIHLLFIYLKTVDLYIFQNKILKKQITKEIAKSTQLENDINRSHDESQNLKKLNDEVHQKLLKDLECKRACAAQLENEVILIIPTAEATKNKEDAELKCQQKIADMVALMEKHKSQYDRMVEEKDAELTEKKKKVNEAVANGQSLELDLSKYKTENDQLKNQLKTETSKKVCCSLNPLKFYFWVFFQFFFFFFFFTFHYYKDGGYSVTQKGSVSKRHIFEFSKTMKAPSSNKDNRSVGSYRIRTPPSAKKAALGKSTIEFDPKSDSSDQNDLLTFANAPTSNFSISLSKLDTFKKIQSPVTHKSPGNTLKLAAMKRMRDAGWTAVTGCDKKKKNNEKIFA
uniref:Synaptonemal complex protein 1 n=1 Tax=Echeneis naucrates TaxID=173247 RepID=A0A665TCR9_ECHNA